MFECFFAAIIQAIFEAVKMLVWTFALLFLLPLGLKVAVFTDYFAHTDWYLANCENKDKPELFCNGKCQMAEALEATELPAAGALPVIFDIPLFFQPVSDFLFKRIEISSNDLPFDWFAGLLAGFPSLVDKPPVFSRS